MNSFDQAFQTAAALGVSICCAAGDAGSGDENPDQLAQFGAVPDGLAHADFPVIQSLRSLLRWYEVDRIWHSLSLPKASGTRIRCVALQAAALVNFSVPTYQSATGIPVSANAGGQQRPRCS